MKECVMEPANRKLIRPSLVEVKEQMNSSRRNNGHANHSGGGGQNQKRSVPPEQTNAENFYYVKQMQTKTPMVFVLNDGETVEGTIEWYDKSCLKIHREGKPNLLIYKPCIKYLYKA
jgi:sRNA-binding regulator protein Hfq